MATSLVALGFLVGLETVFILLREGDEIGEESYGLAEALQFVALTSPGRIVGMLPMAFLLGGLIGMGGLAAGSELVVMRAAGASILRLVGSTMFPCLLVSVVGFLVGEFLAPDLAQKATRQRAEALGEALDIREGRGFWARDGRQMIQVRQMLPDGGLADISIFEMDERFQVKSVARAGEARYAAGQWILHDVATTHILDETTRVEHAEEMSWDVDIGPRLLRVLAVDPDQMSLRDLGVYLFYLQRNGLDASRYLLSWWTKILAPVTNMVMLFISMPFVFGPLRSAAAGKRLFFGILIGLAYFLVNRTISSLGLVYGLPPLLSASFPPLAFFAVALAAMRRIR